MSAAILEEEGKSLGSGRRSSGPVYEDEERVDEEERERRKQRERKAVVRIM